MTAFHKVSLTFEASYGCQLNCVGCRVNKTQTQLPTPEQFNKLLGLFMQLRSRGVEFAEFEIGPTDLVSTDNRQEIFASPEVRWLAQRFQLLALNAGMVYPHSQEYERFAQEVSALASSVPVSLVVPIDLKHAFNEKYTSVLKRNIAIFRGALRNVYRETIIKVIFDEKYLYNDEGKAYSYQQLFEQVQSLELGPNSKVDFAFHHGRDGKITDPLVSANFLYSLRRLNDAYVQDLKKRDANAQLRHLPYQLVADAPTGELVYNNGELYVRPVLNERTNVFDELMRFKGPWTAHNYFEQQTQRLNDNLELGLGFEDCASCEHLPTCAAKNVQQLMHLTHTKRCISLLRQYGNIGLINEAPDSATSPIHVGRLFQE